MKVIKILIAVFLYCTIVSCPALGQVTSKKQLTRDAYHLWSKVELKSTSKKGNWVSYTLSYESGNDTLVVQNKSATKTYAFAKGTDGKFANDTHFICMLPEKELIVVDLKLGKRTAYGRVKQANFSNDGMSLIILNDANQLRIEYLKSKRIEQVENVSDYYMNATATAMVYTVEENIASLYYCVLDENQRKAEEVMHSNESTFQNIVWHDKGEVFAFVKTYKKRTDNRNDKNLYVYSVTDKVVFELDVNSIPERNELTQLMALKKSTLVISDDAQCVFFYTTEAIANPIEKPVVQLWNGNDSWTYSQIMNEIYQKPLRCFVWWLKKGIVKAITQNASTKVMLTGDEQYAITYDVKGYDPQFTFYSKTNFYATELLTGTTRKIIENQIAISDEVSPSYGGKYIVYRSQNDWKLYDLAKDIHKPLTNNITESLYDSNNDRAGEKPMYDIAGWTANDEAIILYDEYDVWMIDIATMQSKRLTKGREKNIVFRLTHALGELKKNSNLDATIYPLIDLEKGFCLKATDKWNKKSGYYFWQVKEQSLLFRDKAITELVYTPYSQTVYVKMEDYANPPQIIAIDKKSKKSISIFKSNPQHKQFDWGSSRLITYTNSKGVRLQGALFYPANYDATKKYPMLVYIYEKLSNQLHHFVQPSVYTGGGINSSVLNAKGYFVLYPDISYEIDQVGESAKDCVESATKAVIDMGVVQPDKIGLMGHSFGGYEVNYIATQSILFATVISGAGVADLLSSYLSIGWNNGRPEIWRYEQDQWRMSTSLYEGMSNYLKNSPIMFANKVQVPMLIWTGEQDKQVHYSQSIAFYNALRRLGKKQVLLIYPENRHRLTTPKSQMDFSNRYEQWLDTYLKDLPPPEWIVNGTK